MRYLPKHKKDNYNYASPSIKDRVKEYIDRIKENRVEITIDVLAGIIYVAVFVGLMAAAILAIFSYYGLVALAIIIILGSITG